MITFLRNYLLQYLYKSIDAHIEQFINKLMIDFADIYNIYKHQGVCFSHSL